MGEGKTQGKEGKMEEEKKRTLNSLPTFPVFKISPIPTQVICQTCMRDATCTQLCVTIHQSEPPNSSHDNLLVNQDVALTVPSPVALFHVLADKSPLNTARIPSTLPMTTSFSCKRRSIC